MKATPTSPATQQEREEFFRDIYRPPYHGERLTWKEIKRTFHSQEAQQKIQEQEQEIRNTALFISAQNRTATRQ